MDAGYCSFGKETKHWASKSDCVDAELPIVWICWSPCSIMMCFIALYAISIGDHVNCWTISLVMWKEEKREKEKSKDPQALLSTILVVILEMNIFCQCEKHHMPNSQTFLHLIWSTVEVSSPVLKHSHLWLETINEAEKKRETKSINLLLLLVQ